MLTPLVSCLCVTRSRIDKLQRAIDCFNAQTYQNRELIVVSENDDAATTEFMTKLLSTENIRHCIVDANPKRKLGQLRNFAIEKSKGDFFCQWDDDDWYHQDRLLKQLTSAVDNGQPGSILTNWIIFDESDRQAYFSNIRVWEGSILFSKSELQKCGINYPALSKNEDTIFIQMLINKSKLYPLAAPALYIYTVHGKNTWERNHFENSLNKSQKLSGETSRLVYDILCGKYPPAEASRLISDLAVIGEVNFLHAWKTMTPAH
jgi:glycosyltransferase involved in cell wall biosynthesis